MFFIRFCLVSVGRAYARLGFGSLQGLERGENQALGPLILLILIINRRGFSGCKANTGKDLIYDSKITDHFFIKDL